MDYQELRKRIYNDITQEHSELDKDLISEMVDERMMWIRMSQIQ